MDVGFIAISGAAAIVGSYTNKYYGLDIDVSIALFVKETRIIVRSQLQHQLLYIDSNGRQYLIGKLQK